MDGSQHAPAFNMKAVIRETGLKPDTLRAWERRYGVPKPSRSAGGHRLYSQYQVDMLKWFLIRQQEGMAIRHAVELWQSMIANEDDPFEMDPEFAPLRQQYTNSEKSLHEMRRQWLACCLKFEEPQATQILSQAFANYPAETVCFEILQSSLNRLGQLWYEGSITVQQEHFCSVLAVRQLDALLAAAARPTKDTRIIVACPPFEQHNFSALLLSLLFRNKGWQVIYLGPNVPVERFEKTIKSLDPHLVVLPAQTLYTAGMMVSMVSLLNEMNKLLAYGGGVFTNLEKVRTYIGGHFLGDNLAEVPDIVSQLLKDQKGNPEVKNVPERYRSAVNHFIKMRGPIEAYVHQHRQTIDLNVGYIHNANSEMGKNNIIAALNLGDINLVTENIFWMRGLLMNFHFRIPDQTVHKYIGIYHDGAKKHLGSEGQLILDWFQLLQKESILTEKMYLHQDRDKVDT